MCGVEVVLKSVMQTWSSELWWTRGEAERQTLIRNLLRQRIHASWCRLTHSCLLHAAVLAFMGRLKNSRRHRIAARCFEAWKRTLFRSKRACALNRYQTVQRNRHSVASAFRLWSRCAPKQAHAFHPERHLSFAERYRKRDSCVSSRCKAQ